MKISHATLLTICRYSRRTGLFVSRVSRGNLRPGDVVGSPNVDGYLRTTVDGKHYYVHRLIWFYVTGRWPRKHIDHRNGIRSDNGWVNMRQADVVQNGQNRGKGKNNTSGVVGVYFHLTKEGYGSWAAHIKLPSGRKTVRGFKTFEQAALARLFLEVAFFGRFRRQHD